MSIYDALDAIPAGRVAVSVDVPAWAVVNLDTGEWERLYVESHDIMDVTPHDYVDSNGRHYVSAFEVEPDEKNYPRFLEELDCNGIAVERALKLISEKAEPDLEVFK